MASASKKKRSKLPTPPPTPPRTSYPAPPHIVGLDWLELPVAQPAAAAALLVLMGFTARGFRGASPMVAAGGLVIMLKGRKSPPLDDGRPAFTLQLTTDNINLKRQQLLAMDLSPGPIRRQPRGDMAFIWKSPDGYAIRFVGPLRD